jgi:hypothetical protein
MPSGRVTANTSPQTIATAPKVKKGKVTFIQIENRHTAAVQVTLQDVYSVITPTGVIMRTVVKKTFTPVAAGGRLFEEFTEPEIEFIGALQAVADTTTADCEITVGWRWE